MDELYLNGDEQQLRQILFAHCEDEQCGFGVKFNHPNSTFFFCKEHGMGFNLDLNAVPAAGVECKQHSKMDRYDLLKGDNICPYCNKAPLAILSDGRRKEI